MIATLLHLSAHDFRRRGIRDDYSIHRLVYDLFEDVRNEEQKQRSHSSGIQYIDKGSRRGLREILIISDRPPRHQDYEHIRYRTIPEQFLQQRYYQFEVLVSPSKRSRTTKKIEPIRDLNEIRQWFFSRCEVQWGFSVPFELLNIEPHAVSQFSKSKQAQPLTLNRVKINGSLTVTDSDLFQSTFKKGIGRGRAFGLGLLQLVPTTTLH